MTAVLLVLALAAAKGPPAGKSPKAGEGPAVLISKSDGTEARGALLSFERGTYRLLTKTGKELDIPATEIDLVRFPRRGGKRVEKLPMPPTPPLAGDEMRRRGPPAREAPRIDGEIRKLRKEGRLGEFVRREEEALRKSGNTWEAMRHLTRLHQAAVAECGRDSAAVFKRVRQHIEGIEDRELGEEVKKRIRWLGIRKRGRPFRGRPPSER